MNDHPTFDESVRRNTKLLKRRIRARFHSVPEPLAEEAIDALVLLSEFPTQVPIIRAMNKDLFCEFCGQLHDISVCMAENVVEYRSDPDAYMKKYVPAALRTTPKIVKLDSPPRLAVVIDQQSITLHSFVNTVGGDFCEVCGVSRSLHPRQAEGCQNLTEDDMPL